MRGTRLVVVGLLYQSGCCLLVGDSIFLLQASVSKGEGNEVMLQDDPSRHRHHNQALGEDDGENKDHHHKHKNIQLNGTESVWDRADAAFRHADKALRHGGDDIFHGISSFMKKLRTAVREEANGTIENASATVMLSSKKARVSKPAPPTLALLQHHGDTAEHHHRHRHEREEHVHEHESKRLYHNNSEENSKSSPGFLERLGLERHKQDKDPNAYKNRTRKERAWIRADKALREGSDHLFHNLNAFVKKLVTSVQSEMNATVENATQLLVKEAIVTGEAPSMEPRLTLLQFGEGEVAHHLHRHRAARHEEEEDLNETEHYHHHHEHSSISSGSGSSNESQHEHHHKIVDPNAYKNRTRKEKAWVRADKALRNTSHTLFHNLNAFVKKLVSDVQSEVNSTVTDVTMQLAATGHNITA